MIEVEKKFKLTEEQKKKLLSGASLLAEKTFTDIYFDTKDYSLSIKDTWLRKRDKTFELKIPLNDRTTARLTDQYKELDNEKEIAEFLKLSTDKPLDQILKDNEINQFCSITTKRKEYKKDKFIIDINEMDFGYNICEIELLVNDITEIKNAENEIINFAKQFNLSLDRVRGKVLEYLKINNPEHIILIEKNTGK